ncbi:MAG: HD-GYP domain-containing protein [Lachnospiraceae bacterium]|nr:HD-GYP domain-containing protein [Lachnospiraceae bacterium]
MEIKRIQIMHATEGMILAEDVYTSTDKLLVTCNTILTSTVIQKIKKYGIFHILVYEKESEEATIEEEIEAKDIYLHKERLQRSQDFNAFKQDFEKSIKGLKKTFGRIMGDNGLDETEELLGRINAMVKHGHGTLHIMDMLNCMREYDDVTYAHSISVGLLCRLIGEWLKYPEKELQSLTLAGLVHDIGKLQISYSIISKPGKLTSQEYKIIQTHPRLGYNILMDKDFDKRVKLAALMHHERCDGSGYPFQLQAGEIDYWSKIVSIADVYDAMTADRSYRKGMCPFDVLNIWGKEGYIKHDPGLLMLFMEKTAYSYINSSVRLSDGRIGEIVSIQKDALARPLVRVGESFVDLNRENDIVIQQII